MPCFDKHSEFVCDDRNVSTDCSVEASGEVIDMPGGRTVVTENCCVPPCDYGVALMDYVYADSGI